MSILVVGDANLDLAGILPGFPAEGDDVALADLRWVSGGAAANVATGLALLDVSARILARVGSDPAADVALAAARAAGVDLALVQVDGDMATGLCFAAVSPGGARTFFSFRGANVALADPPGDALDQVTWLHVAGHALLTGRQRETTLHLLEQAHRRAIPVSLDLCLPLVRARAADTLALLPHCTIVFGNEAEIAAAGAEGVTGLLVIKRGVHGCRVLSAGNGFDHPAIPVIAVDTTGCGDAFVAGFLSAYRRNEPLERCAALANGLGALVASSVGAALPPRETIRAFLAAHGLDDTLSI